VSTANPAITANPSVLRRLELDVTRRLDGILQGSYQGLVPGQGSELGEARVYQPGDDVRRIDWNVSARSQQLHLRETVADRELECWVIADRSASLDFGTADMEKSEMALAAAAGVGFLATRGGNRVGAVISSGAGLQTVPPRQGRLHLMAVLERISTTERADGPARNDLGATLQRASIVARRRGLAVVISDFLDEPETWRHPLAALGHRHQVLCVEVVDPRELELPAVGVLTLVDPESGRVREIDTSRGGLRDAYAEAAAAQRLEIRQTITGTGADHLQLRTDRDWILDLARHITGARRRRANVGGRR